MAEASVQSRSVARAEVAPLALPASALLRTAVVVIAIAAAFCWAYWLTILDLAREWWRNDDYSVGALVPIAAVYMLWLDKAALAKLRLEPAWSGLTVVLLAQAARLFGLVAMYESAERYAMVLTLVGLTLLVTGWTITWRIKWVLLFLFLMVPLPGQIHNRISSPLQSLSADGAVVVLELLGITVAQEGHIMVLNGTTQVGVAEACSGLRMLTAFVVVSALGAYMIKRPVWQRMVILASSIPVAILCNLIRLVVTAALFLVVGSQVGQTFFHDFAGLTMMPLAVVMLLGELWIMSLLVVEDQREQDPTSL